VPILILFLDFDGVLHPDPCFDALRLFEQVPRLEAVLAEFPETDLVLSTNWRTDRTLTQLREFLGSAIATRVVGATPYFGSFAAPARLLPYHRHAECVQWLLENDAEDQAWIALDDRASMFAPACDQLIECDSARGLDDSAAGRLRFALLRARRTTELRRSAAEPI
jgi:hypothetical protein